MLNVLRPISSSSPCQSYSDSATVSATFVESFDGNWNLSFLLSITSDTDTLLIEIKEGGAVIAWAEYAPGDDIVNDAPAQESNWSTLIQPYLTGDGAVGLNGAALALNNGNANGTFSKRLFAEANNYTFDQAKSLTFVVTPKDSSIPCSGSNTPAELTIKKYNGLAGNPYAIDSLRSGNAIYRANSSDNIIELTVSGSNVGKASLLSIDWDNIILPSGVTGSVTNVDLMRGFQISENMLSNGRPSFFIQVLLEGLSAGGSSIQNKILICICEWTGTIYRPTLAYWNANSSSERQIQITNKVINGKDVLQSGGGSRLLYWNNTAWTWGFNSLSFADALYSPDGSKAFFCGNNSAVAFRGFNGSTDSDYLNNSQWSSTSIVAGQLNTIATNTASGTVGSAIRFSSVNGLCLIGFDGVVGAASGSLMMIAALDKGNNSVVFLQEQSGSSDLVQITVAGQSVISLPSMANQDYRGFEYKYGSNALFVGDGGNNIYTIPLVSPIAISKTRLSDENYNIDALTHTF
jgi:hypothetical protein